jgi:hypothetical protein
MLLHLRNDDWTYIWEGEAPAERELVKLGRGLALPLDRCLLLECDSLSGFLDERKSHRSSNGLSTGISE